jgi:uncharacterized membrane protein
MRRLLAGLFRSLSVIGLALGFAFFAASLTPTLMPRSYIVQGALSGICAAVGYLFGVAIVWLWKYLELPRRKPLLSQRIAVLVCGVIVAVVFLWQAAGWQNSIRELWHMQRLESAEPFKLAAIAFVIFLVAVLLGRLFRLTVLWTSNRLERFVPRR